MAKVKYDVSGATAGGDWEHVQPGLYILELKEMNAKRSKPKPDGGGNNPMLEVIWKPIATAEGEKLEGEFSNLYQYVLVDGSQDGRLRALTDALGLKPKGTIDTEAVVGEKVLGHVKPDKDQDGEYRPRIAKVMPLADEVAIDEDDEEEEEDAEEEEEDESIDLSTLDRNALKRLIKENELEIRVLKSHSDDDIRAAIAEALGGDEEEEEEEDEEDEDEEESENGYAEMSLADLKSALKERGLKPTGKKAELVARLVEDDAKGGDPF